ncbi:MAG TPA: hypothetical protein VKZ58_01830 [Longimicrobiales bacterium]|nr:hypothetical protein [Longimicrobiales bacterium]
MMRVMVLVAALVLTGCASTAIGFLGESVGVKLHGKVVAAKIEPTTLIATDGTSCDVSKGAWEKAEVGKPYRCLWSERATSRPE